MNCYCRNFNSVKNSFLLSLGPPETLIAFFLALRIFTEDFNSKINKSTGDYFSKYRDASWH